jgi:uncharacterized protein DUF4157
MPRSAVRQTGASPIGNQAQLRRLAAKATPAALNIGTVDDPLEREADAVADRVMRMSDPGLAVARAPPQLSRKCAACEEEERGSKGPSAGGSSNEPVLQRKCAACEKEEKIQRKAAEPHAAADEAPLIVNEVLRSPGQPLDAATRAYFEPRFGYDLSGVRVHSGPTAERSAREVKAHAYTVGRDIVFSAGRFAPGTDEGRRLIAHELTHVVQQSGAHEIRASRGGEHREVFPVSSISTYVPLVIRRAPTDTDDCASDLNTPPKSSKGEFASDDDLNSVRESVFEWTPVELALGSRGPAVALIQRLLLNAVCAGVDRKALKRELAAQRYGSATRHAVKRFQKDHTDAIGRPLRDDGVVGPLVLGAMDESIGLAPQLPARDPEGTGDCYGVAKQGPGEVALLLPSQVPPLPGFLFSEEVWELSNFDIAKHFVKTEHRAFLRDTVVKEVNSKAADQYLVRLIGEASTTAGQTFNLPLSEARAHCVRKAMVEAGLDDSRLEPDIDVGKRYAQIRRVMSKATPIDEVEDRAARKVSIVLAPRITAPCIKGKASSKFTAYVACASLDTVRINIGDISDPQAPTYREFIWVHVPWPPGCEFRAGLPPPANSIEWVRTDVNFHLALGDPDQIYAPTEFSGPATHHAYGANSRLVGDKNPFLIGLGGRWEQDSCNLTPLQTPGQLTPIGPVKCGWVPPPPQGDCDTEKKEKECTDDYKKSPARRFTGLLGGVSVDLSKYLPPILQPFVSVGANGALVVFGTTDLKGPQISRAFLYAGATLSGSGADLSRLSAAGAPERDVGQPVQLETGGYIFNSDFNEFWNAELVIHGGSNKIDVDAGDAGTFTFFSPVRNCGGTHTFHGVTHAISPVVCPARLPDLGIPEMKCEKDECSEKVRLAGHRKFTVKIGRATIASLPLAARKVIDQQKYGCAITAAFVNIQSEDGDAKELIHREFVLVTRNDECRFTVEQKHEPLSFVLERQLATKDSDDILALSDFAGIATIDRDGELAIFALTNLPVKLKLPGAFDPACAGRRGATGTVVPVSVVWCGEAPEPRHDTTPDTSHIDRCNAFKAAHAGVLQPHIAKLAAGGYDDVLGNLPSKAPVIEVPREFYEKWLTMPGATIPDAVFVGWAIDPATGNEVQIVAFADIRILAVNSDKSIMIEFLTTICAFDKNGQVVLLHPATCLEIFALPGDRKRIPPRTYDPALEKGAESSAAEPGG